MLDIKPEETGVQVVISGHSHKPSEEIRNRTHKKGIACFNSAIPFRIQDLLMEVFKNKEGVREKNNYRCLHQE